MKTNFRSRFRFVRCGGAWAVALLAFGAGSLRACGDYASMEVFRLAREAVSTNTIVAEQAMDRLRQHGPAGLATLLRMHSATLERHGAVGRNFFSTADPEWTRLNRALDRVGGQRDCAAARLFWHTDLEAAKAEAKVSGRPILSLRLLGRLDEELSCANSRFFRTALYANAAIATRLRDHFVLHWESVRPVPRLTIDFGDGRKLERTVTGNSIHYVLDAAGRPLEALPGLYGPQAFLAALNRAEDLAKQCRALPESEREASIKAYHSARGQELNSAWNVDLMRAGIAPVALPVANRAAGPGAPKAADAALRTVSKTMGEAAAVRNITPQAASPAAAVEAQLPADAWTKLAALHAEEARLDQPSRALMRRKHPDAATAARLALSKARVEDPLVRATQEFERSMAEDTVRNEYLFHTQIHRWFAENPGETRDVAALNRRVYAELFLTPDTDPWLGLRSDAYSAIEGDGVVQAGRR